MATEQLRLMSARDLADACELSQAAGWNQTAEDWKMLLELAPDGCFGIETEGRLVSTTTVVSYGQRLGWIGMVLTRPEYRGRGFARRLFEHALDYADSSGLETVKLDATDQGRPLYEKFGFIAEQPIERWSRPGASAQQLLVRSSRLDGQALELDRNAFAADRSELLCALASRSTVISVPMGFLLARTGRTTAYLGPCVSAHDEPARKLITALLNDSPATSWSWDLLPANRAVVSLASELGFSRRRCLTRMEKGKTMRARDEMTYAIAGFELG